MGVAASRGNGRWPHLVAWGSGGAVTFITDNPLIPIVVGTVICLALYSWLLRIEVSSTRRKSKKEIRQGDRLLDARDRLQQLEIDDLKEQMERPRQLRHQREHARGNPCIEPGAAAAALSPMSPVLPGTGVGPVAEESVRTGGRG